MLISGKTRFIAHLGVPTHTFKAPMILNPWFEESATDCVVVPMGCEPEDFPEFLRLLFRQRNIAGALVTMPHKVAAASLVDEPSTAVQICGACNAVRRDEAGHLVGDMFDGEGFTRGLAAHGHDATGKSALVVGAGGVGSAISASLAGSGLARLTLSDVDLARAERLASALRSHYPALDVHLGAPDPAGHDIAVNATPLGMKPDDPLPFDPARLAPSTLVGEVVLSREETPLLAEARKIGCPTQVGLDMLFAQLPAYLEFFGLPGTDAQTLRRLARITY